MTEQLSFDFVDDMAEEEPVDFRHYKPDDDSRFGIRFFTSKHTPRRYIERVRVGLHPAGHPFATNGLECGDCVHLKLLRHNSGTYFKCTQHLDGITRGPGTDMRKFWPACVMFEGEEQTT